LKEASYIPVLFAAAPEQILLNSSMKTPVVKSAGEQVRWLSADRQGPVPIAAARESISIGVWYARSAPEKGWSR